MRKISGVCIVVILLMAGLAGANTVWNPAGNPANNDPNNPLIWANWNVTENWANGLPVETGDGSNGNDPKAVFNAAGAAVECRLTDTQVIGTLVMGDGSDAGVLRVMNGAHLTSGATSSWNGIGYNAACTLIVEEGALINFNSHLWVGLNSGAVGNIIINGGEIYVRDAFDWGRNDGAFGYITLNSGLIEARYQDASSRGLMDIRFGTLRFTGGENGDRDGMLARINEGSMVGFGGLSPVNVELINGMWTATAISPMNPSPAYGALIPDGAIELSWTNLLPAIEGNPVFVDVLFGTDPDALELVAGVSGVADITSAIVDAPVIGDPPTTYYWKVNSHIYGEENINDANMVEGDLFMFDVTNDFPPTVVIETPDTITWVNEPVQLDATVSDTGNSALHIEWTSSAAGTVFIDPVTQLEDATVEDPIVVVDNAAGNVTLTATVWDEYNPDRNSDTMVLNVSATACEATRGAAGMAGQYPMDVNGDCVLDIADLVIIATDWLTDYALENAVILP